MPRELDTVVATHPVSSGGRTVAAGARGTIIELWPGSAAVEFVDGSDAFTISAPLGTWAPAGPSAFSRLELVEPVRPLLADDGRTVAAGTMGTIVDVRTEETSHYLLDTTGGDIIHQAAGVTVEFIVAGHDPITVDVDASALRVSRRGAAYRERFVEDLVFAKPGAPPNTVGQLLGELGVSLEADDGDQRRAIGRWLDDGGQPTDWLRFELEHRGLLSE